MNRITFILVIVLLLTSCSPSEPPEETPNMGFLAEFFTINKDGRMETYLDLLSQTGDSQAALDAYYESLRPFMQETALIAMQGENYLYLLDKSCTDISARWRLRSYGVVPLSHKDGIVHNKYQISLRYPGLGLGHIFTLTGYYDIDQEQKITAFSLDLNGLPGDASLIELP